MRDPSQKIKQENRTKPKEHMQNAYPPKDCLEQNLPKKETGVLASLFANMSVSFFGDVELHKDEPPIWAMSLDM